MKLTKKISGKAYYTTTYSFSNNEMSYAYELLYRTVEDITLRYCL